MARPELRALVLAAGRGERLLPLTRELPKPLLPVAGRPLAAWTLDRLAAAGADAAALNLHHLGERVRAAFGELHGRLPLVYSPERELLGTGGALVPLAGFLGGAATILVVNGDSLCRWPLGELLAAHRRARSAATLLFHRGADPRRFGGGVALARGRVVAFRRGGPGWEAARTRRVFAGAAALDPALLARLPAGPSDIVAALYEPLLAAGEPIAALETSRPWFDLGTPARYLEAALAWGLAGLPSRGARVVSGAEVAAGARLARTVVESGARVEDGARLVDTLVLPGATVGRGARLSRALVGPGVTIASGERETGCLLTAGARGERERTPLA